VSDPTQPPRDPDAPAGATPPEQPPTSPFPESSLGSSQEPAPVAPQPDEREWAAPVPPSPSGGLTSGDPLGGPAAPPAGPAFPAGYTSPPPPGAGGSAPVYAAPAPGTYQLGSWGARAGAAIIDGLIIGIPSVIIFVALGIGAANTDSDGGTAAFIGGALLSLLVFLVVGLLYAPVMMSRTNGQTVGRMATGIRVIRAGGEPMTFGFAALRDIAVKGLLVGTVSSFTFGIGYLIDVLWPLWDDENRALHDMVVNTRTVKA
jgi:uncharacterized RDD family membrane protein YckC